MSHRLAVATQQDYSRRPVAGNVGSRGIDDVSQVDSREELLDQLLAELALHERVGRDHPDVAGRPTVVCGHCKIEETLSEWHAERVLAVTGRPVPAVTSVER